MGHVKTVVNILEEILMISHNVHLTYVLVESNFR